MVGKKGTFSWGRNKAVETGLVDDEAQILLNDGETRVTVAKTDKEHWFKSSLARGILALVVFVILITFHEPEWKLLKSVGTSLWNWLQEWVPANPRAAIATGAFIALSFAVSVGASEFNRRNSKVNRQRTWVFFSVFLFGFWWFFWYWPAPHVRHIFGQDLDPMPFFLILISDVLIVGGVGIAFWVHEWLEDVRIRRGLTNRDRKNRKGPGAITQIFSLILLGVAGYIAFRYFM